MNDQLLAIEEESDLLQGRIEACIMPHFLEEVTQRNGVFFNIPIIEQLEQFDEVLQVFPENQAVQAWREILENLKNRFEHHVIEMQMYFEMEQKKRD